MTSVSLCVREAVARACQVRAQLAEVVDLAVEHDHDRAVLVVDRLVAGVEVDDPQPLDPEADAGPVVHTAGVRARGGRSPRTCAR